MMITAMQYNSVEGNYDMEGKFFKLKSNSLHKLCTYTREVTNATFIARQTSLCSLGSYSYQSYPFSSYF